MSATNSRKYKLPTHIIIDGERIKIDYGNDKNNLNSKRNDKSDKKDNELNKKDDKLYKKNKNTIINISNKYKMKEMQYYLFYKNAVIYKRSIVYEMYSLIVDDPKDNYYIVANDFGYDISKLSESKSLIDVAYLAYKNHYPLGISPDDIWTTILFAFAKHLDLNNEELRSKFVDFNDKKILTIFMDTDEYPSKEECIQAFSGFSTLISKYVPEEVFETVSSEFNTTTQLKKTCYNLSLMSSMKHYFEYHIALYACNPKQNNKNEKKRYGIPYIKLYGTTVDWKKVKSNFKTLSKYMISDFGEKWMNDIMPILDAFISASKGDIDIDFWNNIISTNNKSDYVDGWINVFYPYIYIEHSKLRYYPNEYNTPDFLGNKKDEFPHTITSTPIIVMGKDKVINMHVHSGLLSAKQNRKTGLIKAQHGWILSNDESSNNSSKYSKFKS
jgi:hypothetical protein